MPSLFVSVSLSSFFSFSTSEDSWVILEFRAAFPDLSLGEGGGVDPNLVSSSLDRTRMGGLAGKRK